MGKPDDAQRRERLEIDAIEVVKGLVAIAAAAAVCFTPYVAGEGSLRGACFSGFCAGLLALRNWLATSILTNRRPEAR